jgi:aspartate/methionine/tyrosine aminotransferase
MTGGEIGYVVVEKEFAKQLLKNNMITTTCFPALLQTEN